MRVRAFNRRAARRVMSAEQMRALDEIASVEFHVPSLLLMENAGKAVADVARERIGDRGAVVVVAGPGNNGGDGFVAARHLHEPLLKVRVFYWGDRKKATGDALATLEMAEKMGVPISYTRDIGELRLAIQDSGLVIDALLGTGAQGALRPEFAEAVEVINRSGVPVLAVDIPSGVNADTGAVFAESLEESAKAAVRADVTVTFAAMKTGLVMYPGASYVGDIVVADIGIPDAAYSQIGHRASLIQENAPRLVGLGYPRCSDSHKGNFGHVAVVAGSVGMTGAATLAAEGALRIGTGLVTCLVPESLNDIMEVKLTEAMTIPVPQGKARAFGIASLESVLGYVNKWDAAVIGPGFGRDEDTMEFTLELIKRLEKPAIIDADALYAVSRDLSVLKQCKAQLVITPHPGEMATLLGTTTEEVQSNRLEVAQAFSKEHGVTVVLKGAGTVIANPGGQAYINTTGSPGMATGGTGDVLSGMIGGLLAQGKDPTNGTTAAVYLHGLAGEIAAEKLSEPAMLASDLANSIGDAILKVQEAES